MQKRLKSAAISSGLSGYVHDDQSQQPDLNFDGETAINVSAACTDPAASSARAMMVFFILLSPPVSKLFLSNAPKPSATMAA